MTSPMTYTPKMAHTVESTTKLPVSAKLPNAAKTLSKSIGFGATKKSPPKAERWVHKHCSCLAFVLGPTCEKEVLTVIIWLATAAGKIWRFLNSDWLPEQA